MTKRLRHALLLGGACGGIRSGSDAFAPPAASTTAKVSSTRLHRHSNGFVGFQGDDSPIRDYNGNSNGMSNQVASSRPSNLSRRGGGSPYDRPSVNDDSYSYPHEMDMERRYSQPPPMDVRAMPHPHQRTRGYDGRLQGGSRYTYQHDSPYGSGYPGRGGDGRTFVETDGRPLDVEVEVWDGPNNTPSKVKMYSEDGARRPMNILSGGGGGTTSVRNVGSMEFPARASVGGGMGAMGGYGGMSEYGYGVPIGAMNNGGYGSPRPSMAQGETVQGGALKTFSLPSHVNAVQVTITSDGLPVNAKVELWGTSTHVKQLAEVYNDNGQTRPFAAVIDVPGGENTIAVRNTGPMEYPIKVVVEPVADPYGMGMDGMMGGGGMMDSGYGRRRGPPMGMMDGGYGPPMPMGGFLPPPPPF